MLTKAHRFHGRKSLRFVYAQGKTVRSSSLALRYMLNKHRQTYRVSVVVGKKTEKSAVIRNRIRRRIYELFRQNDAKIVEPYDIVITVFSSQISQLPSGELTKTLDELLALAGIINK